MVKKVAANSELANNENHRSLRKYRDMFLGASGHNIFVNWSIRNCSMCAYTHYLIYIIGALTLNSQPIAL